MGELEYNGVQPSSLSGILELYNSNKDVITLSLKKHVQLVCSSHVLDSTLMMEHGTTIVNYAIALMRQLPTLYRYPTKQACRDCSQNVGHCFIYLVFTVEGIDINTCRKEHQVNSRYRTDFKSVESKIIVIHNFFK